MIKALLSGSLMLLAALSPGVAGFETAAKGEDPPTGLKFVDPEQLRSLPPAEMPFAGSDPPLRVDLSEDMPEPGLQGSQKSCVAWASAYAVKTYQEKIEQRYALLNSGRLDMHKVFSPAFVYNQINQGRDGGATLVDALNLLSGRGAISWAEMPYQIGNFTLQPSRDLLKTALRYRIAYWRKVNIRDPRELKAQLMAGYPVMIGGFVDESFHRLKPGTVWQHSAGKSLGGHALVLVGYDDGRHAFKVMNSWGTGWADRGFGWIDYRQFNAVTREGYVAKDAINDRPMEIASGPRVRNTPRLYHQPHPNNGAKPDDSSDRSSAPAVQPGSVLKHELSETDLNHRDPKREAVPVPMPSFAPDKKALREGLESVEQAEEYGIELVSLRRQRLEKGFLILEGQAVITSDQAGLESQVLVRLYADAEATRPLTVASPAYALPDGSAVAISPPQPLSQDLFDWRARIPLAQLPPGLKTFWARPVLYVDHFGVATGKAIKLQP